VTHETHRDGFTVDVPVRQGEYEGRWSADDSNIKRMAAYVLVNGIVYFRAIHVCISTDEEECHALLVVRKRDGSGYVSANDHNPVQDRSCNWWHYQLVRVVYLRVRPGNI